MLKLVAPAVNKSTIHQNIEDSDSETENTHPASTSTPIKLKATTDSSRNNIFLKFAIANFSIHSCLYFDDLNWSQRMYLFNFGMV